MPAAASRHSPNASGPACFVHHAHESAPLGSQPGSHKSRVLVVDDDDVNLQIASRLLEILGYEVSTASGALEAIGMCPMFAPDVVLMDLRMPGMTGCEASRKMRAMQQAGELSAFSIVAASAELDPETIQECHQAGMDRVVAKPIEMSALRAEMEQAVRHPGS